MTWVKSRRKFLGTLLILPLLCSAQDQMIDIGRFKRFEILDQLRFKNIILRKGRYDFEKNEFSFVLPNEMKAVIIDRPGSSLINLVMAVGFGSRDELPSNYGLAHLLEHALLFQGKRSKPVKEIHRELKGIGAYVNAQTGLEATFFELVIPLEKLEEGLQNFVDLIFNFSLTRDDLAKEKEIILEELYLQASEPNTLGLSLVYESLFPGHPYGHPIIGRAQTIKELSVEEVLKNYQDFYSPANCALAIVGSLAEVNIEELVRKHFGQIQGKKKERRDVQALPPLQKVIRIEKELDEPQSYFFLACRISNINQDEHHTFDVLAKVIGGRFNPLLAIYLNSRLIPVGNIYVSYDFYRYAGVFLIRLILDPTYVSNAEVEVNRWLRQLHHQNFSPDDVLSADKEYIFDFFQSSKNQVKLSAETSMEDGLKLASSIALNLLLFEDLSPLPNPELIDRLKSSDLRRVAWKYLRQPEMAIVVINPLRKAKR